MFLSSAFGTPRQALRALIQLGTLALPALSARAATFTVTNTGESGAGSLRQAITDANAAAGADEIVFDATVFAAPRKTITLTTRASGNTINTTLPVVTLPVVKSSDALSISAPSAGLVLDAANSGNRVFEIAPGGNLFLSGLTLTGGNVSMQDKRYSTQIELVKLQYSGAEGGLVRGIGVLNLLHSSGRDGDFYALDYRIYAPECDGKTKNDHFREMLVRAVSDKQLQAKTVLFDSCVCLGREPQVAWASGALLRHHAQKQPLGERVEGQERPGVIHPLGGDRVDTPETGRRGVGQAQRVALSRAFVQDCRPKRRH